MFQPGLTNGPCKVQDENRSVRQIKNEKNIVLPVDQFRAFSVYEDKPSEVEVKKREPTFKPFVPKDTKKENIFVNIKDKDSVKNLCIQVEKQPDRLKEPPKRLTSIFNYVYPPIFFYQNRLFDLLHYHSGLGQTVTIRDLT